MLSTPTSPHESKQNRLSRIQKTFTSNQKKRIFFHHEEIPACVKLTCCGRSTYLPGIDLSIWSILARWAPMRREESSVKRPITYIEVALSQCVTLAASGWRAR